MVGLSTITKLDSLTIKLSPLFVFFPTWNKPLLHSMLTPEGINYLKKHDYWLQRSISGQILLNWRKELKPILQMA